MKKKKFLLSIFLIFFCLLYLFRFSYAKYRKNISGDVKSSIASWEIKVNDELISNKESLINNITPTFIGNDYINEGVIAPGIEGYYDIIIDASKVDLDFDYTITSKVSDNSDVLDLITTGYTLNPEDNTNINEYEEDGITGSIEKNTNKTVIRIYIKWNDNDDQTMDNKQDTMVATNTASNCIMNVKLNFTQKNNE